MLALKRLYKNENVTSNAVGRSLYFVFFLLIICCNGENVPDCFQNAGDTLRERVAVADFSTITVFENLNLVIKQGDEQSVEIETAEFLRNDVSVAVEEGRLILRNENSCNFVRDYGLTTIYVTSPNISEIRSSTGLLISSDGVLNFPSLTLVSESFSNSETATTDGSFNIEVNSTSLRIIVNGIAYFKINGNTTNFNINIAAGDSRIEAQDLVSQNVTLNHRGSNDIFVNPQEQLNGVIRGTGDVISVNRPPVIDVDELFNGQLIFPE